MATVHYIATYDIDKTTVKEYSIQNVTVLVLSNDEYGIVGVTDSMFNRLAYTVESNYLSLIEALA